MRSKQAGLGLPPLSYSHQDAKAHLNEYGMALLADVLTADEVHEARHRLLDQAEAERRAGVAVLDGAPIAVGEQYGDRGPNQRIWSLINKGAIFREIVVKDRVLELISEMFAENYDGTGDIYNCEEVLLSSSSANIACQGGPPGNLHLDQRFVPFDTSYPCTFNTAVMLTDFTAENGATLVAPGSHIAPDSKSAYSAPVIPAEAPAGTIMVFDGRLLHGTGANQTDEPRVAILNYYCMAFVRTQENFALTLDPGVFEESSDRLKALLGFRSWNTLGVVDGRSGHHLIPTRYVEHPRQMSIIDS